MLNKNIVLHKIPGYRGPISAIWAVLKININVNIATNEETLTN